MDKLCCDKCGSVLRVRMGYTGTDWESEAGEGSGFGVMLYLNCTNDRCATVYRLGYLRDYGDFSPLRKDIGGK